MIEVSIIIPVFNDGPYLNKTLASIYSQIEDLSKVEVIVVDNGSDKDTLSLLKSFPNIIVIIENKHLKSPYSCRNRGIEIAKGEVIILLDSTCVPNDNWLQNGLIALDKKDIDIIGGKVLFDFESKLTAGKIYDSITNIRMKESIEIKRTAKTANLFIKKKVFDSIGVFPEGIRSGADVRWTGKASQAGFNIVYSAEAIVYKQARTYLELLRKQWRVGLHQPLIWADNHKMVTIGSRLKQIISPVSPGSIRRILDKQIREHNMPEMNKYYYKLIFVGQSVKVVMAIANIVGIFKLKNKHA